MTTVVWDGYTLATDSQVTEANMSFSKMNKIYKLDNGGYLAFTGNAHLGQYFADWLNGKREAPSDEFCKDSAVILIDKDGKAWDYDGTAQVCMPVTPPYAIGSGTYVAIGAMDAGATAEEAVKIAIKRDIYSGGKINVVHINKRKAKAQVIEK